MRAIIPPRRLSPRLQALVEALPLRPDSRVLEIGCGPGAAARAVAARSITGHVLAIDRSARAIAQATVAAHDEIALGRISVRQVAAEDFVLQPDEAPYDLVFAVRVGALDGRPPEAGERAAPSIDASSCSRCVGRWPGAGSVPADSVLSLSDVKVIPTGPRPRERAVLQRQSSGDCSLPCA
jgi:SAM-dependent methyltransferase